MTKKINEEFYIRNTKVSNRICLPPMVMFGYSDESGKVTDKNVEHYRSFAKGGAGLIIQEATCITPEGRLSDNQLGIWSDEQIKGHQMIAEAVHAEGKVIVMQIHHAGVVGISEQPMCPSDYSISDEKNKKEGHAMTTEEIESTIKAYIEAAHRACLAGYDGVELHGCHSYLISQFFNNRVNRREDEYEDPMKFVGKIIDGIRAITPEDFIIGIRLGAYEPTLVDGIRHAKSLEKAGIDFIDVSYGFDREAEIECPGDWKYMDIVYAAGEIKKNVQIPVFAVNRICTPKEAQEILELTNVDMVDIGRSMLVDPEWANKAMEGKVPGKCLQCKRCTWFQSNHNCPGRVAMNRTL